MNPLKPCPFCLTDGDERLIELWDTFDAGHIAHVHCTQCGADGPGRVAGPEDGRNEWSYTQAKQAWWAEWNSGQAERHGPYY